MQDLTHARANVEKVQHVRGEGEVRAVLLRAHKHAVRLEDRELAHAAVHLPPRERRLRGQVNRLQHNLPAPIRYAQHARVAEALVRHGEVRSAAYRLAVDEEGEAVLPVGQMAAELLTAELLLPPQLVLRAVALLGAFDDLHAALGAEPRPRVGIVLGVVEIQPLIEQVVEHDVRPLLVVGGLFAPGLRQPPQVAAVEQPLFFQRHEQAADLLLALAENVCQPCDRTQRGVLVEKADQRPHLQNFQGFRHHIPRPF